MRSYVVSRLLAALVVLVPVSIWELAPADENDFNWSGTVYAAAGSGVVLALVAALASRWTTRVPLIAAGLGWLTCLGVLVFAELVSDEMGGKGLIALLGITVAAVSTLVALLTPLQQPPD